MHLVIKYNSPFKKRHNKIAVEAQKIQDEREMKKILLSIKKADLKRKVVLFDEILHLVVHFFVASDSLSEIYCSIWASLKCYSLLWDNQWISIYFDDDQQLESGKPHAILLLHYLF